MENKQLLLTDLCARLPYVIVHTWYNKPLDIKCIGVDLYTNTINLDIPDDDNAKVYIDNCKPYLRPMSSMTEEEYEELKQYALVDNEGIPGDIPAYVDWLNKNMFDYRGLIEEDLAIAVTKENNPYNNK